MTEPSNIIGKCVKSKRLAAGLNLPQVAKRTGVAASTIMRIENGAMFPTLPTLLSLSDVLDIDLFKLLAELGAHTKRELPEFEDYLREKYGMSDDMIFCAFLSLRYALGCGNFV